MSLKREALIIACPGQKGIRGYLPGTLRDIDNYSAYLQSSLGGDWYAGNGGEIYYLINPTGQEVANAISLMNVDYSFVVFTGHGFTGKHDKRTYICLEDGNYHISILKTSARRQTVILDCCRGYYLPSGALEEEYSHFDAISGIGDVLSTRNIFDNYLKLCETGIIRLHASSIGEASMEEKNYGGYFSYSLIEATKLWGEKNKIHNILELSGAKVLAQKYMNENFLTNQVPRIIGGRRLKYFPFGVKRIRRANRLSLMG